MADYVRVAAACPKTMTGDIKGNTAEIIRVINEAAAVGAKLVVLPNTAITGAGLCDFARQSMLLNSQEKARKEIERRGDELGIEISMKDRENDTALYDKIRCHSMPELYEAGGWEKTKKKYRVLSEIENTTCIVVQSGMTESTSLGVYGGGLLIVKCGRILAERRALCDSREIIFADIEINVSKNPFFPDNTADCPDFCTEIFNIQKAATARRVAHINPQKAILNLSGGLDSALALLVLAGAFDALGKDRNDILALLLPGFGTTDRTLKNSRLLSSAISCSSKEIDIKPACLRHFKDIGLNHESHENHGIAFENAQARERTQIALDIANMENGIMLGTGNMSEIALGFSTFGGDAISMYNPNCGLTKTAVREVVRHIAETELFGVGASAVLIDILNTSVSPELLPPANGEISQITEEIVGPYELIDFFLYHFLKNRFTPEKIVSLAQIAFRDKYTNEIISKWMKSFIRRFMANQFKRISLPEGPMVLGLSLSPISGYFMPGDVNFTEYE